MNICQILHILYATITLKKLNATCAMLFRKTSNLKKLIKAIALLTSSNTLRFLS